MVLYQEPLSTHVIFGEPDLEILDAGPDGSDGQIRVKVNGVDVFHPNTGEVRSDGPEGVTVAILSRRVAPATPRESGASEAS